MILEGSVKVKAPIDKLYDFVMKPESIMGCLPGAEPPTVIDDKTYEGVVKAKVGIFGVKMKYTMRLISTERPTSMNYEGEGEDVTKLGRFKMKMDVKLTQVGEEVEIAYTVDVGIVGKLAMFGDRIMKQKTKQIEIETTKNLQEKLEAMA
jgi:carbon monoxide dehydrogenase subunit G